MNKFNVGDKVRIAHPPAGSESYQDLIGKVQEIQANDGLCLVKLQNWEPYWWRSDQLVRVARPAAQEKTVHDTGAQRSSDADHLNLALIPFEAMEAWGAAFAEGEKKYGRDNWLKGFKILGLINHAVIHLYRFLSGCTKEDHLGHAMWNIGAAIYFMKWRPELDDRPKYADHLPKKQADMSACKVQADMFNAGKLSEEEVAACRKELEAEMAKSSHSIEVLDRPACRYKAGDQVFFPKDLPYQEATVLYWDWSPEKNCYVLTCVYNKSQCGTYKYEKDVVMCEKKPEPEEFQKPKFEVGELVSIVRECRAARIKAIYANAEVGFIYMLPIMSSNDGDAFVACHPYTPAELRKKSNDRAEVQGRRQDQGDKP